MKLIMFLLFSYSASATKYYVANSGNNSNNGLTTGAAWQTCSKVNGFSFASGDSILFNKGDVWREQLLPPRSNLYIGSYGSGNKPVITGLQTLTGFTNTSGNLWQVTASNSAKMLNTVLVHGVITAKGRFPNTGTSTFNQAASTQSKIVITGASNYVGAEIVLPLGYTWIIDVCKVRSQPVDSLYIYPSVTYPLAANRYFLQNLPSFCDVAGEWAYDSTTKVFSIYSVGDPSGNVQISTIDTLVSLHRKDYITFDGLSIIGANNVGICKDTSTHVTIQNCTINYTGGNNPLPVTLAGLGGAAIRGENATYGVTKNDSILNSLNNGIFDIHGSSYDSVYNNYIKNTSILTGMGAGSNGAGIAVFVQGSHATITNNRVDSVGYNGIWFQSADTSLIKNNYVTNFCYNKADGGGIYTDNATSQGSIIRSNIVKDGLGGTTVNANLSPGIYLDNNSAGITVDSNTIDNCYQMALLLNIATTNNTVKNNTVRNGIGHGLYFDDTRGSTIVKKNIFYSTDSTKAVFYVFSITPATMQIDSNYYLRPIKEGKKLWRASINNQYDLSEWIAYWTTYSFDVHSQSTPTGITSAAGILYLNPTMSDSTIYFSGLYYDAKGVQHNNSIALRPYQSALLFKSSTELPTQGAKRIGNLIFNQ